MTSAEKFFFSGQTHGKEKKKTIEVWVMQNFKAIKCHAQIQVKNEQEKLTFLVSSCQI